MFICRHTACVHCARSVSNISIDRHTVSIRRHTAYIRCVHSINHISIDRHTVSIRRHTAYVCCVHSINHISIDRHSIQLSWSPRFMPPSPLPRYVNVRRIWTHRGLANTTLSAAKCEVMGVFMFDYGQPILAIIQKAATHLVTKGYGHPAYATIPPFPGGTVTVCSDIIKM